MRKKYDRHHDVQMLARCEDKISTLITLRPTWNTDNWAAAT
jgi:hypothetical protein